MFSSPYMLYSGVPFSQAKEQYLVDMNSHLENHQKRCNAFLIDLTKEPFECPKAVVRETEDRFVLEVDLSTSKKKKLGSKFKGKR